MRRPNLIATGIILALAASVLASVLFFRPPPEPSYQGRTATEWLRYIASRSGNPVPLGPIIEAFDHMGTNAQPALLAAFRKEPAWRKFYRLHYMSLPSWIKDMRPPPEDPSRLRSAASMVMIRFPSPNYPPALLPLLSENDSTLRRDVFYATTLERPTRCCW